jgi:hypothetical protein
VGLAGQARLDRDTTLTCNNFGGRGRYRTADRWCVKGQDRVNKCSAVSSTSRSAPFPCPIDADLSAVFGPVLGHWRVTGERLFGPHRRLASELVTGDPGQSSYRARSDLVVPRPQLHSADRTRTHPGDSRCTSGNARPAPPIMLSVSSAALYATNE